MIKSHHHYVPNDDHQIVQASTIGFDFPDDVCYEIMTNLDSWHILKYCVLISKQWKRIIKETIRLSLDFKTDFDDQRAKQFKQSQFLDRIINVKFGKGNVNLHVFEALILMPNLVRVSFSGINETSLDKRIGDLKQVSELEIENSRLSNLNSFSSMNNLTRLDLPKCFFNTRVTNIHTLQNLTSLNIESTFNTIEVDQISLLTNLTSLNMANNSMRNSLNHLNTLKKLTHLDISENMIIDSDFDQLIALDQLTSLDVSGTFIGMECIKNVCQLKNLKKLSLEGNRISNPLGPEITQTNFSQLTKLTYLNIRHHKIGGKGAVCIGKMKNLTHLDLGYNDIGIEGSIFLGNLWNLTFLDISLNNIMDGGAQIVGQLKNLTCLIAEGNHISYSGAKLLSKIAKLKILNLNRNSIGDVGLEFISRMKKLEYLFLDWCGIGDQGVTALLDMTQLRHLAIMHNPSISEEFRKLLDSNNYEFLGIEKIHY